jgi:hypothetical protein
MQADTPSWRPIKTVRPVVPLGFTIREKGKTELMKVRKQVAVATAQILFHRFWYVSSMKQFGIGVSYLVILLTLD